MTAKATWTCECFHAPEQHGPTGCEALNCWGKRCSCKRQKSGSTSRVGFLSDQPGTADMAVVLRADTLAAIQARATVAGLGAAFPDLLTEDQRVLVLLVRDLRDTPPEALDALLVRLQEVAERVGVGDELMLAENLDLKARVEDGDSQVATLTRMLEEKNREMR